MNYDTSVGFPKKCSTKEGSSLSLLRDAPYKNSSNQKQNNKPSKMNFRMRLATLSEVISIVLLFVLAFSIQLLPTVHI